jgi:ATP-dependent RNA helicase DeaD
MLHDHVPAALGRALSSRGYNELTEVQNAVSAGEAAGRDLVVSARTGSGKTVAFGLAMAPDLLGEAEQLPFALQPLALVIAPTRELALQVSAELSWLYAEAQGRVVTCVGGMDPLRERRALQSGSHIVVGTPGRLRDHLERGALDLSALRVVVLDEADEMLDMGFREELEEILDAAPEGRRTLLFSATMPRPIEALAKRYQKNALRITTLGTSAGHGDIAYQAVAVRPTDIEHAVINLLRFHEARRPCCSARTARRCGGCTVACRSAGSRRCLSGDIARPTATARCSAARQTAGAGRDRRCGRGIDLPVSLVDPRRTAARRRGLQHRSGRTGRAGRKGLDADRAGMRAGGSRRCCARRAFGRVDSRAERREIPAATDAVVESFWQPSKRESASRRLPSSCSASSGPKASRLHWSGRSPPTCRRRRTCWRVRPRSARGMAGSMAQAGSGSMRVGGRAETPSGCCRSSAVSGTSTGARLERSASLATDSYFEVSPRALPMFMKSLKKNSPAMAQDGILVEPSTSSSEHLERGGGPPRPRQGARPPRAARQA